METKYKSNLEWIKAGNTACIFATLFAKNPEVIGWNFFPHRNFQTKDWEESLLVSVDFPKWWTKEKVREWSLLNGFYLEETSKNTEGLRIRCREGVAWVQYFGPDAHIPTRMSPTPMLMFTNKLGKWYYIKVGWKGILHLAHAWYSKIDERVYDLLWERSYKQTKKKLGKTPDIQSAAKTTWLK